MIWCPEVFECTWTVIKQIASCGKNDTVQKFMASNGSLHFHNLWNEDLCFEKSNDNFQIKNDIFMKSQKENSEQHTKRQVDEAKEAQNLHWMMMFPSASDFKNATKMNCMHNCPVTVIDIDTAEDIFGKDIFALKGKTTRKSPFAVTINAIDVPPEIVKLHNDTFLGIDMFCIKSLAFFIVVSSKIKLVTTEEINNENMRTILNCIKSVVKIHNERNPRIATIAGDDEFDSLKNISKENVTLNAMQWQQTNMQQKSSA